MDEEVFFCDATLLKAFAKEHSALFLAFVEEYLREMETEANLRWEKENNEE